jgi:hypothetical protein
MAMNTDALGEKDAGWNREHNHLARAYVPRTRIGWRSISSDLLHATQFGSACKAKYSQTMVAAASAVISATS